MPRTPASSEVKAAKQFLPKFEAKEKAQQPEATPAGTPNWMVGSHIINSQPKVKGNWYSKYDVPPTSASRSQVCPPWQPPSRQHKRSPAQDVAKTKSYLSSCMPTQNQSKLVDHLSLRPCNQRIFQTFVTHQIWTRSCIKPFLIHEDAAHENPQITLQPEKQQTTTISRGPGPWKSKKYNIC